MRSAYSGIQGLLGLGKNPQAATLEAGIRAYKENQIVPVTINFADETWVNAIQSDIDEINKDLKSLSGWDLGVGGIAFLSPYFLGYFITAAALVINQVIVRREIQAKNGKTLEKLIKVFEKLSPEDTHKDIALRLAEVIAPLVMDENIIRQWMKPEKNFPYNAIQNTNPRFLKTFEDKGFFKFANFNSPEAAVEAFKVESKKYDDGSILETLKLLLKHSYATMYGQRPVLSGDFGRNIRFYSKPGSPGDAEPVVSEKLGVSIRLGYHSGS